MTTKLVRLTCLSCGDKLEIRESQTRLACGSCGTEFFVERGGGTVSLELLEDKLDHIKWGTTHTAHELKIARLDKEISELQERRGFAQDRLSQVEIAAVEAQKAFENLNKALDMNRKKMYRLLGAGIICIIVIATVDGTGPLYGSIAVISFILFLRAWAVRPTLKVDGASATEIHEHYATMRKDLAQCIKQLADIDKEIEERRSDMQNSLSIVRNRNQDA